MTNKQKKWKIIAAFIFIIILGALLLFLFVGDNFKVLKEIFNTNASKEEIQQSIEKLGIRSYFFSPFRFC